MFRRSCCLCLPPARGQLPAAGPAAAAAVSALRVLRGSGLRSPVDRCAVVMLFEATALIRVLRASAAGSGAFRRSAVLLGRAHGGPHGGAAAQQPEQNDQAADTRQRVDVSSHDPFSPDLYKRLGLEKVAQNTQIKAHFKELTKRYHPDLHQGSAEHARMETAFRNVKEAHEVLSKPAQRSVYDRTGDAQKAQNPRHYAIHINFIPKFLFVLVIVMFLRMVVFPPARTERNFRLRVLSHCLGIAIAIYMLPRFLALLLLCVFHHRDMQLEEMDRVAGQLAVAMVPGGGSGLGRKEASDARYVRFVVQNPGQIDVSNITMSVEYNATPVVPEAATGAAASEPAPLTTIALPVGVLDAVVTLPAAPGRTPGVHTFTVRLRAAAVKGRPDLDVFERSYAYPLPAPPKAA